MKKTLLAALLLTLVSLATNAQKVNEKVQIDHNGTWYDGKILKVNAAEGKYYVGYDGWDDTWNEWVTADHLKGFATEAPKTPLTKFAVGDKVEVEYGMIPEPATVLEVGENKYHIKYDNTLFKDKWVTEKEIKKL